MGIEANICVDKFAVCFGIDRNNVVGHLKEEASGKYVKTILYFLRSDNYLNCIARVSGNLCNLKDEKGLQTPCSL